MSQPITSADAKSTSLITVRDNNGNVVSVVSPNDFQVGTRSVQANLHVSGVLTVGSGTVKITSNDIQFGNDTRIERTTAGNLYFYDQANPLGTALGGGGALQPANNLSDLASARTALQNLGAPLPTLSSIGTWTADEDGVHIYTASGGSTFSHKVKYITAPSTPWILAVEFTFLVGSNSTAGLWFRRSSTGKIVTWSFRSDNSIHVYRWTDVNTFSADVSSTTYPSIPGRRVLAAKSDGTTINLYHLTGVGMGAVVPLPAASASETIATHLGGDPDQIGIYSDSYDNETQLSVFRMRTY